jgi:transposase
MLLDDLAHYNAQYLKADQALRALAQTTRHQQAVEAMETVSGVGPVTAMAMRTELIAPERFNNGREVSAMAGLAPLISRTGQTVRQGPLMKCGNGRLRTVLIEAAWRWVAKDRWARQRFTQLIRNTGEKKKAIAAMARRLVIILWRISVTGEAYRPRCCDEAAPPQAAKNKKTQLPREDGARTRAKGGAPSVVRRHTVGRSAARIVD